MFMDSTNNSKKVDPSKSHDGKAPEDPSNTSHIGQRVEQEIISKKEGITTQSSEWEDKADENEKQS